MSDVEGVDGSESSWPDIVQYAESIAEKSKHQSVYCYLRVPHGLERSARKLVARVSHVRDKAFQPAAMSATGGPLCARRVSRA